MTGKEDLNQKPQIREYPSNLLVVIYIIQANHDGVVREIRDNEIFNKVVEDILTHESEKNKIKYILSLIKKLI
jgi:hypothetical protein